MRTAMFSVGHGKVETPGLQARSADVVRLYDYVVVRTTLDIPDDAYYLAKASPGTRIAVSDEWLAT